tara:strand:- start:4048 stop:4599 length:552 start_codon:yes stop_codon:yes gene_type:complete
MGCALSNEKSNLTVNVCVTPVFSSQIGGTIELFSDQDIGCDWRKGNNTALVNLSHDRMKATNVQEGKYDIHCTSLLSGEKKIVHANVKRLELAIIDSYKVTHASNDMARDGVIEAYISHIDINSKFLWTSGVITNEPILHDVSPGIYCVTVISNDKVPIPFYHGCSPAIVNVVNKNNCLIHPL